MKPRDCFAIAAAVAALGIAVRLVAQAPLPPGQPRPAGQGPAPADQRSAPPPGDATNGRKLFVSVGCYQCHGFEAQGSVAGPRLGPRPIAQANFLKYVRRPANQMPPYTAKVTTDTELFDIYAFLQALPEPQPLERIPLLK